MQRVTIVFWLYFIAVTSCNQTGSNNLWKGGDFQNRPVWGNIDESDKAPAPTRNSPEGATATPHPCDPFVPPNTPDFSRGRRIHEAKCLEYIWAMKVRHDNETHDAECTKWRSQFFGRRFVVGGRDTTPGEFPHMGALGWRAVAGTWIFKCGCSLISPKFVVTAAHCSRVSGADTSIVDPSPQIVRLGDKTIIDGETNVHDPLDVKISRIIIHPQYTPPKKYYDIALVQLAEVVVFTKYVQPACLWGNFDTSSLGKQATVTGWGYIDSARTTTAPHLQVAVLDFIDQKQCDALLLSSRTRLFSGLQPHQLCAGKLAGGVDTCQGDSGGPLQVKIHLPATTQGSLHHLVGVTSFGIGCARENVPGVYTRVASFIDWIEDIVWGRPDLAYLFQR